MPPKLGFVGRSLPRLGEPEVGELEGLLTGSFISQTFHLMGSKFATFLCGAKAAKVSFQSLAAPPHLSPRCFWFSVLALALVGTIR